MSHPTPSPLPVAAVVLAAGSSRRFGADNKLLALIDGEPLVARIVRRIAASSVAEIVVVTGHEQSAVEAALAKLAIRPPLRLFHNPRHAEGIGRSIATGIAGVSHGTAGALVCLGDMPETSPTLINRLIAEFRATGGDAIVVPTLPDGSPRNPVLWPRRLFPELDLLRGDTGAKPLLAQHVDAVRRIPVDDPKIFADIDTGAELEAFRKESR